MDSNLKIRVFFYIEVRNKFGLYKQLTQMVSVNFGKKWFQ